MLGPGGLIGFGRHGIEGGFGEGGEVEPLAVGVALAILPSMPSIFAASRNPT